MINFMRNIGEDNYNENFRISHNYNTFNNTVSNDSYNSNNSNNSNNYYNLCIISSCIFIIYFLLTIPTLFMDIILGFMFINNCSSIKSINLITINNWLITNGILYYINLTILILLNRVYTENTFFRKILKSSCYLIAIFILIWSILGITIFFTYYYKTEKCQVFFYNYILIRIFLSPLIVIFRFIEIYNS